MSTEFTRRLSLFWKKVGVEVIFYYGSVRFNQTELAGKLGLKDSSYLSLVRQGKELFSEEQLFKFCEILGATEEYPHLLATLQNARDAAKGAVRFSKNAYIELEYIEKDCFEKGLPLDALQAAIHWQKLLDRKKGDAIGRMRKNFKIIAGKFTVLRVIACQQAWPNEDINDVTARDLHWIRRHRRQIEKNNFLYYFRSADLLEAIILKLSGDRKGAAARFDKCLAEEPKARSPLIPDIHRDRIVNAGQLGDIKMFTHFVKAGLAVIDTGRFGDNGSTTINSAIAIGYRILADRSGENNDIPAQILYEKKSMKFLERARLHEQSLKPYSPGMASFLHADIICSSRNPDILPGRVIVIGEAVKSWARNQYLRSLHYVKGEMLNHWSPTVRNYAEEEIYIPPKPNLDW